MSGTISTSIGHGITLVSSLYSDPVRITGTIDASGGAALFAASSWTVYNDGNITAANGEGIFLKAGGVIDNSGSIVAPASYGIASNNVPLDVVNSGYIEGGKAGIEIAQGAISLDNQAGGTIAGGASALEGLKFSGEGPASSTMVNAGLISSGNTTAGGGMGVRLGLASATNAAGGVIAGGSFGVYVGNSSTFSNFGLVSGQTGIVIGSNQPNVSIVDGGTIMARGLDAISFAAGATGSISDSLTLLPGAVLDGVASGGGVADVVFGGASPATMASVGHAITMFSTIDIAAGAQWDFSGTSSLTGQTAFENSGTVLERAGDVLMINSTVSGDGTIDLSGGTVSFTNDVSSGQTVDFLSAQSELIFDRARPLSGTIANFQAGDTIQVTGFGTSQSVTSIQTGNLLTLSAAGSTPLVLTFAADPGTLALEPLGALGGTTKSYDIVAPCFRAGTRLLTPQGPRAVEGLRKGDCVVTHDGTVRPIIWHGQRRVDCARHPHPEAVLPILIEEGAFGRGVPSRDLYVSPDHAIYCDAVLIPAKALINGVSIRQIDVPDVVYHHIELETHDVIWAETLPAETYLECGNRHNFARQKSIVALHPDFMAPRWNDKRACAPLVLAGPALIAVRRRLQERLTDQGVRRVPGSFTVHADGRPIEPVDADGGRVLFRLPPHAHCMTLDSSAACPADLDPASLDRRRLGMAMADVTVDGVAVTESCDRFGAGFHEPEMRGRRWFRWTSGSAVFNVAGVREIAFNVQAISSHWQVPAGWRGGLAAPQRASVSH